MYGGFQGILDWVMDSMKRDNKEVQERLMVLQKEKDEVNKDVYCNTSTVIRCHVND